ncbi:MAG: hypothetical protein IKJ50_01020 [Clostridia bacterium]|nr:hypothetical protein [Clostridia bacterium]
MYICQKCNYSSESPANFCPVCGSQMVAYQPTYTNESNSTSNRVKRIVGMGLSIEGFVFAALTAIYVPLFLLTAMVGGETEMGIASLVASFVFGIFGLPGSIIGLVFSNQARTLGDTSAFSRVGKALGLAGVIVFAACFTISIFATTLGV